jgi:hypothetical protein
MLGAYCISYLIGYYLPTEGGSHKMKHSEISTSIGMMSAITDNIQCDIE